MVKTKRAKLKLRDTVQYYLDTKYDVLTEVIQAFCEARISSDESKDWQEAAGSDEDVDFLWSDHAISVERFIKMQSYQKVNHFVGMTSITRKNNLGRNLLRMKKKYPDKYRFFPDTWILPTDLSDFKMQFNGKKNKTFIVKPSDGYQGKGIFLTRDFESIPVDYNSTMVVQRYIHKPWLLDAHKFDVRLYVLVTGCDPLRIFLHEHGLVRLASEEYTEPKGKNLQRTMMHLTNYAINCDNPNFEENNNPQDGNDGHKRSWKAVLKEFEEQGMDTPKLVSEIEDLIVKTLLAVQPSLSHVYRSCQPDDVDNAMCFEILGFDVMLDYKAKPWLIEVNHAPSFRTETDLDRMVKFQVLYDALELVNITPENRRRYKQDEKQGLEDRARGIAERRSLDERQSLEEDAARVRTDWESTVKNGYKRLYPITTDARAQEYEKYIEAAVDIWETLTGSNSRRKPKKEMEEDAAHNGQDGARRTERPKNPAWGRRQTSQPFGGSSHSAKVAADSGRSGSSRRSRSADKVTVTAAVALGAKQGSSTTVPASSALPGADKKVAAAIAKHAALEVGDIIQVQTNLGWEAVTVTRKNETGTLDIQFKDGEIMAQVMPRILKKPNANASSSSSPADKVLPSTSSVVGQASPACQHAAQSPEHQQHRQGARSAGILGQPPVLPTRPPLHTVGRAADSANAASVIGAALAGAVASAASQPLATKDIQAASTEPLSPGAASSTAFPSHGTNQPRSAAAGAEFVAPSISGAVTSPVVPLLSDRASTASAAAMGREGYSSAGDRSSPLRPPPRPRGSTEPFSCGASTAGPGIAGERCSTSGSAMPVLANAGLHDYEPALQKKIKQALQEGSLHRLCQKMQAGPLNAPAADNAAERQAKSRMRVRPLLPPRGPGWSTISGSANISQRPALTIEARGVPSSSSGTRPRPSSVEGFLDSPSSPHGSAKFY